MEREINGCIAMAVAFQLGIDRRTSTPFEGYCEHLRAGVLVALSSGSRRSEVIMLDKSTTYRHQMMRYE